jgi:hypothetical protein
MTPQSNTPPEGDFVRYVERLTSSRLGAPVHQRMLAPGKPALENSALSAAAGSMQPAGALTHMLKEIPFKTHLQRVAGLWVASQVLAHFLPGAGFLFIPALIAYAAWVLFGINRHTFGALLKKMQQLAETAVSGQPGENRK